MSEIVQKLAFADKQSNLMIEKLETLRPGATAVLRADALSEIKRWDELRVMEVSTKPSEAGCSLAGTYNHTTTPPTITLARSDGERRKQFTILHELGHHLQKWDTKLAAELRRGENNLVPYEESACDLFASKVLIDERHALSWGSRAPSASDVVGLFHSTNASRQACSVWSSNRLGTNGVVVVLDKSGVVSFAAHNGSVLPPAKGSDQSETPLIKMALSSGEGARKDGTYIQYRNGTKSSPLYGDAQWADGYLIAVLVTDRPSWAPFAPSLTASAPTKRFTLYCKTCNTPLEKNVYCDKCGFIKCPHGHCDCPLISEKVCARCYLSLHPNLFPSSEANICKDCS